MVRPRALLLAASMLGPLACGGEDAATTTSVPAPSVTDPSASDPPPSTETPVTEPSASDPPPATETPAGDPPTTAPVATDPPTVEPSVTVDVVPMPDHVTEVQLPWWTADGESLVLSARSTEFDGMQIVRVDPDGSDFACLTCDISSGDPPLMKPIAFDDGVRVMVRIGNQTPFTNGEHAVLECSPSVAQCDDAALVPIVVPVDDVVVQPQREFRVAPGGERVGFTQMRANGRGDPVYVSMVAGLRRESDRYELIDARVISHLGELKQFSSDGRLAYVSSFVEGPEAGNGDVIAVDLTTGATDRVTWYPDYDEPVEPSPDGRWFTVGSARTAAIFEPIAAIPRPNVLGAAISPLALHLFNTYRDELLEPFLISASGEEAGEIGLLLNPGSVDDGWEGRMIPNWNVDGRRIVFWEADVDSTAGSADAGSRVVVSALDGIGEPGSKPAVESPDLSWARPLDGFRPPSPEIPESRDGLAGGRMDVTVDDGDVLTISVIYTGFSDDGDWVIDGTETIINGGGPTGSVTYTADLQVTGEHTGYLRAVGVDGTAGGGFVGTVESEIDGERLVLELG